MVTADYKVDYSNFETYFNGEWIPYREVLINPEDRGFTLADVVFDIGRTFNGKPFALDHHINRMYKSLQYVRIDPQMDAEHMTSICEEAVQRNNKYLDESGDFTIHPWVTRGVGSVTSSNPTVCISIKPVNFAAFAKAYIDGVKAVIAKTRSYSTDMMDPKVKHHNRMNFVLAELEAKDVDANALPVLMDGNGNLTEGSGYNVFLVKDGILKTPKGTNILWGVSRRTVMEIAKNIGIQVVEEDLQPYDIYTADEVFFTRTSPRITPVNSIDNRIIGDGKPGTITRQLLAAHSERVGVDIVDQALHHTGLKN
ncbi:MAG: branched-chain amino acid aminotransferase [Chloroflexi bacterium]|nr:branched-chain amino acid aminotransferase [Chloroflexota bacterium]|tara:strand:+ start:2094 stop:3026 length:933 start_codon:yes stop_codon:yes gene_type:complete